ncbi:MAG TPA: GtrA family protein [Acidimicrobiia bacterium]|nr:GtrA family protein [Acidimicrobiia bacterium]
MSSVHVRVPARFRSGQGAKLVRFGAVSAFNVILGQILLLTTQVALDWPAVAANVFAVTVGAVPAYMLSRYWVWEKRGRNRIMREVIPFWTLTLIGFAVSTAAVWYVDTRWDVGPLVVNITNLAAFGLLWVAKFAILDRVLFRAEEAPALP